VTAWLVLVIPGYQSEGYVAEVQNSPTLEVSDLSVEFPGRNGYGPIRAVDSVSFSLAPAEIVGLVGESGSGKSMTLLSVLGLVPPPGRIVGGSIKFRGREIAGLDREAMRQLRGDSIALIPADALGALNPVVRAGPQTRDVIIDHRKRVDRRDAMTKVIAAFRDVHLPSPETRVRFYPHQLSGGMQQRVVIATGLLLEPGLLLADEPTTALDVTVQAQVLRLLLEIRERAGAAILFVSHDLATVSQISDRILVMYAARLVETGSLDRVFAHPFHPYTSALIESAPSLTQDVPHRLQTVPGAAPDLRALPKGCRFAPRCWLRERLGNPSECDNASPPLRVVEHDRLAACHFAERVADERPSSEQRAGTEQ
jgi:oligopeptide/dipeptide ABC transporter ATP-binding protein